MGNIKVLVVDDDRGHTQLISHILKDEYDVLSTHSGIEAVQLFEKFSPDLVLLDISMPDIDGYEVCSAIKAQDPNDQAAIIFVSGMDSTEERIKGYQAGADDYIPKPFQPIELKNKIAATTRYQQTKKTLASKEELARSSAIESMKEASQYSQVLGFLKASFTCNTLSELSNKVFESLDQLGLNGCTQIRSPAETLSLRPNDRLCSPMETELFDVLKGKGRLYAFGQRMMVNDNHVSILIKNMPTADEAKVERLNDILSVIIEGFEARLMDIERKQAIESVLNGLTTTMELVRKQFINHQRDNVSIMDRLVFDMGTKLHALKLTPDQEDFFIGLVQESMSELANVCYDGKDIEDEISKVTTLINPLLRH